MKLTVVLELRYTLELNTGLNSHSHLHYVGNLE